MKIRDLMTKEVESCTPDASAHDAVRMMWEHDCGSLPVVDRDTGRVVGMVTDRDIAMGAYLQGKSLPDLRVRDVMSKEIHVCRPEDAIADAREMMQRVQIRRLPVVDEEGRLVGLFTIAKLAKWTADNQKGKHGPALNDVGETLAHISRPTRGATATAEQ